MYDTWGRRIATLVVASALAGCASQGAIQGRLEEPGKPPTPVTMEYQTERFGEGGTLSTTLPSGEHFTGRYLQITSETTADTLGTPWDWGGWGPFWGDWGPYGDTWMGGYDYSTFVQNYSDKVVATLFGDQKHTMRCRFKLADPEEGITGGGIGECQLSSGETIQAQF